ALPDGSIQHPLGQDAVGLLVYTANGHMTGQVMQTDRGVPAAGYRALTPKEVGYIAYCGTYTVDDESNEVVHHVTAALFPNWIGSEQRRAFEFSGNHLILSARVTHGGEVIAHRLVWERV